MAESVILFIEDEVDHFEAVKEHLEPDFKCTRCQALQIETIAKEIANLQPVAVVVDLMLFSSSRAAKAAMAALRQSIAVLETSAGSDATLIQPSTTDDDETDAPVMASDWLRALKDTCPGVPLVAFSQLEATAISLEQLVSGAFAKRLDTKARLINGKEFAERVRQLING
jgi:hypothetical protein